RSLGPMRVRSVLSAGRRCGTGGASMSTSGYMYGLMGRSAASQSRARLAPPAHHPAVFLPPNDQLQIALALGTGERFHGPGDCVLPTLLGVTGNLALLSAR